MKLGLLPCSAQVVLSVNSKLPVLAGVSWSLLVLEQRPLALLVGSGCFASVVLGLEQPETMSAASLWARLLCHTWCLLPAVALEV